MPRSDNARYVWLAKSKAGRSSNDAHRPKLAIPQFQELIDRHAAEFAQIAQQIGLQRVADLAWIAVGAAERLGNDVVDDAEPSKVLGGQLQRLGGQSAWSARWLPSTGCPRSPRG